LSDTRSRNKQEVAVKNFPSISGRAAFRLCLEATRAVLAVGALLIFGSTSYGQPIYELLSTFDAANHGSANPYDELIQASDGNFYGTTLSGGTSGLGTIFKMDGARRITTIHSFTGSDGASPRAGLVQARDGKFYGATFEGGAFNAGTIFKVTAAGTLTTIRHLAGPDGSFPAAALIQARDGNLYGVTAGGGAFDAGTAFKMDAAGTLTTIHSFQGADGSGPWGRLFEARDGTFYGTTASGTIFKMDAAGRLTTLHTSTSEDDGRSFVGIVQANDGSFYGTTATGGTGVGTVFRIDAAGTFKTIHRFSAIEGAFPRGRLMQASDGRLFGTTNSGGLGFGTIFLINVQGEITTVHTFASFTAGDGGHPDAGLIEATDGNLYGVAISGGGFGDAGVVYRLNVVAQRRSPTADAYVRAGASASTNFGAVTTLLVKKGVSADNTSRSYLTFDVGELDAFSHATLRVFGRVANAATPAVVVTIYAVNDTAWAERTVTWNTRPDLGALLGTRSVVGTAPPQWLEVDVTAFVRAQRAAGNNAITFALRSLMHTSAAAVFNSREATGGQPQLVIRR
jgi:uncharacterized repeat protein (TIGR03803 family)